MKVVLDALLLGFVPALKGVEIWRLGGVRSPVEEITSPAVFFIWWSAELHRLRGVFLTAMGADDAQIEASFCNAISVAKQQKSISLAKRAEGTYAEYQRQKASALRGRGFRLPL